MAKPSGLGKGLSSLIPKKNISEALPQTSAVSVAGQQIVQVAVTSIKPNPHQPRSIFNPDELEDLVSSIREHGIIQPLIVVKDGSGYQLIAGERRLRASQEIGLDTVPVIVREFAEQEKLEVALIENVQRSNLNPVEEAVAYQRLIDEFNLTQEQVAQKVGKSRAAVANTIRILALPTEIQKALINKQITFSTARVIAGLPPEERIGFFKKVLEGDLTARAVEGQAKKITVKKHARTKVKDPQLAAYEEELQAALGTKVNVKKSGTTGSINIEFYSEEELKTLTDRLISA